MVVHFIYLLRSHYRNYDEHKGLAVLNSGRSYFEILGKEFSPKSYQCFNRYISPFVGYWHRLENWSTCLKLQIIYLVKYLCCKTEHKTQHEFLPKTKDFEAFME